MRAGQEGHASLRVWRGGVGRTERVPHLVVDAGGDAAVAAANALAASSGRETA